VSTGADLISRFPWDDQLLVAGRAGMGAICGLLIGLERQLSNKVVGLRTHMLVASAAALATGMGELLYAASDDAGDPSRILHAVVTGVGFLGAGAIFRGKSRSRGLTTAATLFLAAVLGAVAGLGAPILALTATALAVVSLRVLLWAEEALKLRYQHEEDV
jgi:putative Mg2+ transporter-C (MgtC) family protein